MILCAVLLAAIAGDALGDLRTTLAQLSATSPVHGSFDVMSTSTDSDHQQPFQGKASVRFDIGDDGLRVIYPKATLAQASAESRAEASDPERQTPVRSGMERVHALQLADLLDAASMLTTQLLSAQLIDSKAATLRGANARLLTFKVSPKLSKGETKHLKRMVVALAVWLGDDGIPLAAERKLSVTASFMLLSFAHDENEKWDFARSGDRLVAARYEQNEKSQGLGQHENSQVVEVLRLEP